MRSSSVVVRAPFSGAPFVGGGPRFAFASLLKSVCGEVEVHLLDERLVTAQPGEEEALRALFDGF